MNDTAPQPALREWRTHMTQPARAACFLGAAAILALVGPFDTDEAMHMLPRFAYWGVIVVLCYSTGYFGNIFADRWVGKAAPLLRRIAIAAPLTASGVLAIVYVMNGLTINYWASGRELAVIAGNVLVISSIITTLFYIAETNRAKPAATPNTTAPALLDRLPFEKRGPLVALTVQDHYVNIRTTNGSELVLMRLADAIREVGDTKGLQVHRSHWIAVDQVTAASRKGDGAVLSMTQGDDIPVSRANVAKIREAGLLPRT